MKEELIISFTGDILAYEKQNELSKCKKGYNYEPYFIGCRSLLSKSDYVVGSIETPCAGWWHRYTHSNIEFNTPEEILDALKLTGFDMLTTANNHALDRGISGLKKTIKNLDDKGIDHTGTRLKRDDPSFFIKNFDGVRVAFMAYTYGTNSDLNGCLLNRKDEYLINLTREQDKRSKNWFRTRIKFDILSYIPRRVRNKIISRRRGRVIDDCVQDSEIKKKENEFYIIRMKEAIREARQQSDIVVFCLHSGGQFNGKMGGYTRWLIEVIKKEGVDAIICNHTHSILPIEREDGCIVAQSLGNFSYTPQDGIYVDDELTEYSAILHLIVDRETKKICRFEVNFTKSILDTSGYSRVIPVGEDDKNYKKLIAKVKR